MFGIANPQQQEGHSPTYNPNPTPVYGDGGGGGYNPIPSVIANGSGIQVNATLLDKIMASVLSGMALIQHAPYVPTGIQPAPTPVYLPTGAGSQLAGGGSNSLGKVESWLKNNTGVALMGAAAVALFMMKPPSKR